MEPKKTLFFLIGLAPCLAFSFVCQPDGHGGCVDPCKPDWLRMLESNELFRNLMAFLPILGIILILVGFRRKRYAEYRPILMALGVLLLVIALILWVATKTFTCFT